MAKLADALTKEKSSQLGLHAEQLAGRSTRVFFKPELPLTGTNKIDRRVLAEEAAGLSRG